MVRFVSILFLSFLIASPYCEASPSTTEAGMRSLPPSKAKAHKKKSTPEAEEDEAALPKCDPLPIVAMGNPGAPVKVVMYHSLSCVHCKKFKLEQLPEIKETYIDTGKVFFEFQDFPTDALSMMAIKLAWCHRDLDTYRRYSEAIIHNLRSTEDEKVEFNWADDETGAKLLELMETLGVGKEEAEKCLAKSDVENAVLEKALDAQKNKKLNYAPGFFVNGQLVEMEQLERRIKSALIAHATAKVMERK